MASSEAHANLGRVLSPEPHKEAIMPDSGLDALWEAISGDLPPDTQTMLLRLIKAHVRFLAEMVRVAEQG